MYDERTANLAPNVDNVANSSDAQRALEDWQSALDQRVQDRTASILNSDQQTRFEQFMARQREARNAFASFSVAQSSDNANAGGGAPPSAAASPPGP
jgi:4-alpha-glucanotransferase